MSTNSCKKGGAFFFPGFCVGTVLTGSLLWLFTPDVGKVDIYSCDDPGEEIPIELKPHIMDALGEYANQPGVDIDWDPKRVVCTVDSNGELSFHIEKSQEELVDVALGMDD